MSVTTTTGVLNECQSSIKIHDAASAFGNHLTISSDAKDYFDDNTFKIKESIPPNYKVGNPTDALDFVNNRRAAMCEVTECWLLEADVSAYNVKGQCGANFSNVEAQFFDNALFPAKMNDANRDWMVRVTDSKYGYFDVNPYPSLEFRIWLCVRCTNFWQTITTEPFMVDVQCSSSLSTTITIPPGHDMDPSNASNLRNQEYQASIDQGTLYFEFSPFSSSTNACPIVLYRILTFSVDYTNHHAHRLNYLYGRNGVGAHVQEGRQSASSDGQYRYEIDSFNCLADDPTRFKCEQRQQ
jgi:hypothetical protein